MKIVGDLMTAGELKERILKSKYRNILVIGKLETVVDGGTDHYWHIHDKEQIPVKVDVLLKAR